MTNLAGVQGLKKLIKVGKPTLRCYFPCGDDRARCPRCGAPTCIGPDGSPLDLATSKIDNRKGVGPVRVAQSHLALCQGRKPRRQHGR